MCENNVQESDKKVYEEPRVRGELLLGHCLHQLFKDVDGEVVHSTGGTLRGLSNQLDCPFESDQDGVLRTDAFLIPIPWCFAWRCRWILGLKELKTV